MNGLQERTAEILKKIRTLEIKTKGLVETAFAGDYHSVFKGRGMNFEDVREYQPGDEIRAIDWNVTARITRAYERIDLGRPKEVVRWGSRSHGRC